LYNAALRLAYNSNDPELHNRLEIRLLDCNDANALAALDLLNPTLPEAQRDAVRVYVIPPHFRFCIQIASSYTDVLYVTVVDCTADGSVQYLGDLSLNAGDRQLLWQAGRVRNPFIAAPAYERGGTDRLIAVATTRPDVNLRYLEVRKTVQQVVNESIEE